MTPASYSPNVNPRAFTKNVADSGRMTVYSETMPGRPVNPTFVLFHQRVLRPPQEPTGCHLPQPRPPTFRGSTHRSRHAPSPVLAATLPQPASDRSGAESHRRTDTKRRQAPDLAIFKAVTTETESNSDNCRAVSASFERGDFVGEGSRGEHQELIVVRRLSVRRSRELRYRPESYIVLSQFATARGSNRTHEPTRKEGILPAAACLKIVTSETQRNPASSLVVIARPIFSILSAMDTNHPAARSPFLGQSISRCTMHTVDRCCWLVSH